MKRTALALYGKSSVGKSSSLIKTHELLRTKFQHATVLHEDIREKDITVIVEIGGVKIGIESAGDPMLDPSQRLKIFLKFECDIILCAARSWGKTCHAVDALAPTYELEWTKLWHFSDLKERQSQIDRTATHLVARVEDLMTVVVS